MGSARRLHPALRGGGEGGVSESWSLPDADGIVTLRVDVGAASTLKGQRRRRGSRLRPGDVALWPASWRALLADWLRQGDARRKWATLLQKAGGARVTEAHHLLESLLKAGLVEVMERRERGSWQTQWVEFLDLEGARGRVGLPNRDLLRAERDRLTGTEGGGHPLLTELRESLAGLPAAQAIRRHELLSALEQWLTEERSGTRRDFALFARGDTKGISAAEWAWLESGLDLEESGIGRHTPALWFRAPLRLITENGALDLRAVPDAIALTPATVEGVLQVEGTVGCWRVLENRTVFERAARQFGDGDGVLWVPGFAPGWWKKSVMRLLNLCPAPALVACDPDPAGVEIASGAGALWGELRLPWRPWGMSPESLARLRSRKPLSDNDRARLVRLLGGELAPDLEELCRSMLKCGEKGEQEGIKELQGKEDFAW